jgi:hypothetical protein
MADLVRDLVAGQLRASPDLAATTVYAYPPEAPAAPALVITPRSPYRVGDVYGVERYQLTILVLLPRAADVEASYARLDRLCDATRAAILDLEGATWNGVQSIGPTQPVGGVEYLSAACDVDVHRSCD